jgi:sugar (pentulose or hexulose) kinase
VTVPPGADGLLTVLDWLAPADHAFRKGSLLGFDARHTRAHLYRSVLEAIAMTMRTNVDAMRKETGVAIDRLVMSGGGASSGLFAQIFADVFGLTAQRSRVGGAALGSAMCAAAAAGLHPSVEAASSAMASARHEFVPNPDAHHRYDALISSVYRDIRSQTDPIYQRSFPLFH